MTPQMGLASHAFSKCRKSFIHLISDITSTNIQLNEIERRHLQQLYLKWKNASFLESDLQLFFDMKEHHQILNHLKKVLIISNLIHYLIIKLQQIIKMVMTSLTH